MIYRSRNGASATRSHKEINENESSLQRRQRDLPKRSMKANHDGSQMGRGKRRLWSGGEVDIERGMDRIDSDIERPI